MSPSIWKWSAKRARPTRSGLEEAQWVRPRWETNPIYVDPDSPCWFAAHETGNRVLREGATRSTAVHVHGTSRFRAGLPETAPPDCTGREDRMEPRVLKEFWIHLTTRRTLSCTHCLFASSPSKVQEIPADPVLEAARQAHAPGSRLFALTGGQSLRSSRFSSYHQNPSGSSQLPRGRAHQRPGRPARHEKGRVGSPTPTPSGKPGRARTTPRRRAPHRRMRRTLNATGLKGLASTIHPYPTVGEALRTVGDHYNGTCLTPRAKWIFP